MSDNTIEAAEKYIGSSLYLYRPLTATPAYKLLLKLVKMLGPSFASMAAGKEGLSQAANLLAQNLDEEATDAIIKQLVKQAELDGKPMAPQFEMHFAKRTGELLKFLAFALEAQFGDFLGELLSVQKSTLGQSEAQTSPKQMAA